MKIPEHNKQSLNILTHLIGWGFSPAVQQRIGAFGVVWGVFETNLETTLWALCGETVAGLSPSTDKTTIKKWITALSSGSAKFPVEAQDVLRLTAVAAEDLRNYRHALVHGWLIPYPTMPSFILNPSWNGELRSRPSSDAHVDENLLDMAIDAAWVLCRVIFAARQACTDINKVSSLTALKSEVIRAKGQANELRHLTALMNHEKY